ncbi:MAG: nitrogen fixation protein NifZ [Geminicoccaceae bacterium]|nr:MAG: nitrogen fixation protein NifZ [Geminicoccaceae bacterium]
MERASARDAIEVYQPPAFVPGTKVRAKKTVRNDGTMPGAVIGDVLVTKGDEGYVRDVGVFLQEFYVYSVEFVALGRIVGMRRHELVALAAAEPRP